MKILCSLYLDFCSRVGIQGNVQVDQVAKLESPIQGHKLYTPQPYVRRCRTENKYKNKKHIHNLVQTKC